MADTHDTRSARDDVARAAERLRLAEFRLSRRRQNDCGPSENARAAMRFVYDRADAGEEATPSVIADHLGVSAAAVTGMLDRLHAGGLVAFRANPSDGRSKLVVPMDRADDLEDVDPLTRRIRELAEELPDDAASQVAEFLRRLGDIVDGECR